MSYHALVAEHFIQVANSHFISEMLQRHKDASDLLLGKRMMYLTL